MKRFHVHVAVPDPAQSIRFYSALFGVEPTVRDEAFRLLRLGRCR